MSCQAKFPLQDVVLLLRDKINPEVIGAVSQENLEEEVLSFMQDKIDILQHQLDDIPDDIAYLIQYKTVNFYPTVADMVADKKLKSGKLAITAGYYAPNDGGGARYLIKDTATDYSIPVSNSLHAVFADSFDIRKFGIRNNATLDQTTEIQRMVNYADTRVYEIDFLGYSLATPKTWTDKLFTNVRGLTFYYPHAIKNLFITHDKTVRLEFGHNLINFLPVKNPAFETYFSLENVEFDAWSDNYQPFTDNYNQTYDGMRHGLFCHPAKDSDVISWGRALSNISFSFKNVRFSSPAYSYNITLAGLFSKNTYIENMKGEFVGLFVNFHTKNLQVKDMHGTYIESKLESGRSMVRNLLHYEAELGAVGNVTFDNIDLENVSCYRIPNGKTLADKDLWSAFRWANIGSGNVIEKAMFTNVDGAVIFEKLQVNAVDYKDSKNMSFCIYKHTNPVDNLPNINIDNCGIRSIPSSFGIPVYLGISPLNELKVSNSTFYDAIFIVGGEKSSINKLTLNNVDFKTSDNYCIGRGNYSIKELYINGLNSYDIQTVFWFNVKKTIAKNIHIINTTGDDTQTSFFTFVSDDMTSSIVVDNLMIDYKQQMDWTSMFRGFNDVLIKNSVLNFRVSTENVNTYKQVNVIPELQSVSSFDPPSLTTGTQQTTVLPLSRAKVGDNVSVSFNQPLQGTRMWAEVTAPDTVTVYHRNDTGATVDLPSGTLTIKIV